MLNQLKQLFGITESDMAEEVSSDNALIEIKALQIENRKLKATIRKQDALLKELSDENIDLARDRQFWANTATTQRRLLDVYEEKKSGGEHEIKTA